MEIAQSAEANCADLETVPRARSQLFLLSTMLTDRVIFVKTQFTGLGQPARI